MAAAKDMQGQKAVAVVIAVIEAAFLIAVDGIVGGIEVQHQFVRRQRMGFDEEGDEQIVELHRAKPAGAVLHAAEGRRAGQGGTAAGCGLEQDIVAQGVVVVEILVALYQREDAQAQHAGGAVDDLERITPVGQQGGGARGEVEAEIDLAQEQQAAVTADLAAMEVGFDAALAAACKGEGLLDTFRHRAVGPVFVV